MSVGVVWVVEDHVLANANELPAEGLSEMFVGEYDCGRPDGYGRCVEEEDLLASTGVVEAVGGHHDCAPGGEFLVDDIEDDGA